MAEPYDRTRLNYDEWLGARIARSLEAIRYADVQGLETELELVVFAEDVLDHFEPRTEDSVFAQQGKTAGSEYENHPLASIDPAVLAAARSVLPDAAEWNDVDVNAAEALTDAVVLALLPFLKGS